MTVGEKARARNLYLWRKRGEDAQAEPRTLRESGKPERIWKANNKVSARRFLLQKFRSARKGTARGSLQSLYGQHGKKRPCCECHCTTSVQNLQAIRLRARLWRCSQQQNSRTSLSDHHKGSGEKRRGTPTSAMEIVENSVWLFLRRC